MKAWVSAACIAACMPWVSAQADTIPAAVDGTAMASFTDIQWQVIDLDPNDGIAAGVSFQVPWAGRALTETSVGTTKNSQEVALSSDTTLPVDQTSTLGSNSSSIFANLQQVQVQANASEPGSYSNTFFYVGTQWNGDSFQSLVLRPNTELRITGLATARATDNCNTVLQDKCSGAVAHVLLGAKGPDFFEAAPSVWVNTGFTLHDAYASQSLSLTLTNYRGSDANFELGMNLGAYVNVPPLPVPEPSTLGLSVAGLAAIASLVRRRQARRG